MIKNVWAVYFSPSGSTAKIAEYVAEAAAKTLNIGEIQIYDWTLPQQRQRELIFTEEDMVIMASPTYAGRIPNKIMPFVRDNVKGNGAAGAAVMTYGNRAYENSLMEMTLLMKDNGFRIAGGGAAVCRHVMSEKLAAGRPSMEDMEEAGRFGRQIAEKILNNADLSIPPAIPGNQPVGSYYKPLEEDGKPASFLKAKPALDKEVCNNCGVCAAVCPMGSINRENVSEVTGVCIKCQACVLKCPVHARYFDDPSLISHIKMLENNYAAKVPDNEWYL